MANTSSNLTLENWFQTTLNSSISATDTSIPLATVPSGSEGFLVIEPDSTTNREVIFFTTKTSSQVTCPSVAQGRGQDGTSAIAHNSGVTVRMTFTKGYWTALKDGSALNIGALAGSDAATGWLTNLLPAVSTVTHNGNRSYDVVFASTVASIISPGMRMEFTKTVAGNGYMGGAFNGSSQYFTKTSPSGTLGTVTNNFTIEAVVQPTSYADGTICARSDATPANNIALQMNPSGQVYVSIRNGGAGNSRSITTYQSLSLNKKTHVAASWTSGTVVIYFDGVSVPVQAAVTGGTAPTVAGTGGDFAIGRFGAYAGAYFAGYISNVAVFDAVLSAATIKQHSTIKLLGSETNCIGAWSLDNTANDQSSAGNNLTAQGGVGFTAMSPHGQLGDAVQTTKAVGLVMAVNGATVTVQTPEGVTIPTTGGITSVAYSVQANPFGWVDDDGRWEVGCYFVGAQNSTPSNATWYRPQNIELWKPSGSFICGYSVCARIVGTTTTYISQYVTLSTSASSETDIALTTISGIDAPSGTLQMTGVMANSKPVVGTASTLYLLHKISMGGGVSGTNGWLSGVLNKVTAVPTGL